MAVHVRVTELGVVAGFQASLNNFLSNFEYEFLVPAWIKLQHKGTIKFYQITCSNDGKLWKYSTTKVGDNMVIFLSSSLYFYRGNPKPQENVYIHFYHSYSSPADAPRYQAHFHNKFEHHTSIFSHIFPLKT